MGIELKKFLGFAKEDLETAEMDQKIIKANDFLRKARELAVLDNAVRDAWAETNTRVYGKLKLYEAEIKADIKAAEAPVKRLKEKRDAILKPTDLATKIIAQKILDYDEAAKKKREAAERKRQEEAEAERRRLQKIEDDRAAKEAKEKQDKALKEAAELEAQGQGAVAVADIILKEAAEIKPEPVTVTVAEEKTALTEIHLPINKQEGRREWEVTVLNIDLVPNEFVKKEIKLGAIKKKLSETDGKIHIPGLAWEEKKTAVRG